MATKIKKQLYGVIPYMIEDDKSMGDDGHVADAQALDIPKWKY
ncbi:MAG: hypothetical protein U5K75_09155 [Ahrensia sp.]|nr:hypothetical protein [Ahrensia sp.]